MRIGDEAVAYAESFHGEHGGCVVGEAITVLQVECEQTVPQRVSSGGADQLIATMICPTCLISPSDDPVGLLDEWAAMTPATCPTCGQASIEWALAEAATSVLREMIGLERLDAAIQALETD